MNYIDVMNILNMYSLSHLCYLMKSVLKIRIYIRTTLALFLGIFVINFTLADTIIPGDIDTSLQVIKRLLITTDWSPMGSPIADLNSWGNIIFYPTIHDSNGNPYISNESDPVFSSSSAAGITSTQISRWNNAYSRGNHSTMWYLTSESDPLWFLEKPNYYTKTEVDNLISSTVGGLRYKWIWDYSTGTLPSDVSLGYFYKISTEGDYNGLHLLTGDMIIANEDISGETNPENWDVISNTVSETDPVFSSSVVAWIWSLDITHWNDAYNRGNHNLMWYLTGESDPIWSLEKDNYYTKEQITSKWYLTGEIDPQWNTDKSDYYTKNDINTKWYLTSFSESDPEWNSASGNYYTKVTIDEKFNELSGTVGGISNELDPIWSANSGDYYTKSEVNQKWFLTGFNESDPQWNADKSSYYTKSTIDQKGFITGYNENDPLWNSTSGDYYTKSAIDAKGFLTNFTELDPLFSASAAAQINSTNISNWDSANDWIATNSGNSLYFYNNSWSYYTKSDIDNKWYLTSFSELDPLWNSASGDYYTKSAIDNKWYLTNFSELDPMWNSASGDYYTKSAIDTKWYLTNFSELDPMWNSASGDYYTKSAIDAKWYLTGESWNHNGIDINYTWGNVGIGTNLPLAKLHIIDTTLAWSDWLTWSILNLTQTWNTTWGPSAIKLNVINTASSSASKLIDLQVGGATKFYVDKAGTLIALNLGIGLQGKVGISSAGFYNLSTNPWAAQYQAAGIVDVSVGSTAYNGFHYLTTINQTGTANGITRWVYINPSITNAADFRAIELTNNIGKGIWQTGTGTNSFAGNVGIWTTNPTTKLQVTGHFSNDIITSDMGFDYKPIPAPNAGSITGVVQAGAGLSIGNYYYTVTFYTSIGETNGRVSSVITTTTGNQNVLLTIPTSTNPAVIGRKIYRYTVNGTSDVGYLLSIIANNTATTYTDTTPDSSLSGDRWIGYKPNTTAKGLSLNGSRALVVDPNYTQLGYQAGFVATSAGFGTFIGSQAGRFVTYGLGNTLIGHQAGYSQTEASSNTIVGSRAGWYLTTGSQNTIFGSETTKNISYWNYNTSFGYRALYGGAWRITGGYNIGIGASNGNGLTTGNYNILVGGSAGSSLSSASENIVIGHQALMYNILGSSNIALGYHAGRYITGGSTTLTSSTNSIFIGDRTRAFADNSVNEIVIGSAVTGLGSNTVVIGNSSITKTVLNGNVGIGTTNPVNKMHIDGTNALPATVGSASNGVLRISNNTNTTNILDIGTSNLGAQHMAWIQARNSNNYTNNITLALNPNGGSVGVNTSNPRTPMSMLATATWLPILGTPSGNFSMVDISNTWGTFHGIEPSGKGWIQQMRMDGSATAYDFLLQPRGGNVGIGTTSPSSKLDVAGDIELPSTGWVLLWAPNTEWTRRITTSWGALSFQVYHGSAWEEKSAIAP